LKENHFLATTDLLSFTKDQLIVTIQLIMLSQISELIMKLSTLKTISNQPSLE